MACPGIAKEIVVSKALVRALPRPLSFRVNGSSVIRPIGGVRRRYLTGAWYGTAPPPIDWLQVGKGQVGGRISTIRPGGSAETTQQ